MAPTSTAISKEAFSGAFGSSSRRPETRPSRPRTVLTIMCFTEKLTCVCDGSMYQNICCFPSAAGLPAGFCCLYNQLVAYAIYSEVEATPLRGRDTRLGGVPARLRDDLAHARARRGIARRPAPRRAFPPRPDRSQSRDGHPADRARGALAPDEERRHARARPPGARRPGRAAGVSLGQARLARRAHAPWPTPPATVGAESHPRDHETLRRAAVAGRARGPHHGSGTHRVDHRLTRKPPPISSHAE